MTYACAVLQLSALSSVLYLVVNEEKSSYRVKAVSVWTKVGDRPTDTAIHRATPLAWLK